MNQIQITEEDVKEFLLKLVNTNNLKNITLTYLDDIKRYTDQIDFAKEADKIITYLKKEFFKLNGDPKKVNLKDLFSILNNRLLNFNIEETEIYKKLFGNKNINEKYINAYEFVVYQLISSIKSYFQKSKGLLQYYTIPKSYADILLKLTGSEEQINSKVNLNKLFNKINSYLNNILEVSQNINLENNILSLEEALNPLIMDFMTYVNIIVLPIKNKEYNTLYFTEEKEFQKLTQCILIDKYVNVDENKLIELNMLDKLMEDPQLLILCKEINLTNIINFMKETFYVPINYKKREKKEKKIKSNFVYSYNFSLLKSFVDTINLLEVKNILEEELGVKDILKLFRSIKGISERIILNLRDNKIIPSDLDIVLNYLILNKKLKINQDILNRLYYSLLFYYTDNNKNTFI